MRRADHTIERLARGVTLLCAVLALAAFDPFIKSNGDVETGNERVKQGKHKQALDAYDEAAKDLPRRPGVQYDRGVALYKLGKFDDARKALLAATATTDAQLKRKAFFNLGNSMFQLKRWQGAIDAYRRALRVDPTHKPSKWNLELALRELQKKKKKNSKKNKKKNKQDDKKKQKKQDDNKKKQDDNKQQDDKKKQQKQDDKQKKQQQQKKKKDDQQRKKQQRKQGDKKKKKQNKQRAGKKRRTPLRREIDRTLKALDRSDKNLQKRRLRRMYRRRRPVAKDW